MRRASNRIPESAEKTARDIRRATRRHHSAEEKIRIVLEGLRGEVIRLTIRQRMRVLDQWPQK
jgi:transposase